MAVSDVNMEMNHPPLDASPEGFILIFVTTATEEEANKIGRALVEQGLVACANILPMKKSIFKWEGKVSEEEEVFMLLKSREDLFNEAMRMIKHMHSYQVPEIIAIPLVAGSSDYLNWVMANTHK